MCRFLDGAKKRDVRIAVSLSRPIAGDRGQRPHGLAASGAPVYSPEHLQVGIETPAGNDRANTQEGALLQEEKKRPWFEPVCCSWLLVAGCCRDAFATLALTYTRRRTHMVTTRRMA